jgi:hypothetical protein
MKSHRSSLVVLLLTAALSGLSGCSGRSADPSAANGVVRGQVTLDDRPLGNVTVVFVQPETAFGLNIHTDENGQYEVRSHKDQGLPPGQYKIAVRPSDTDALSREEQTRAFLQGVQGTMSDAPTRPRVTVPQVYHTVETSNLAIEVTTGDNPPFDFKLTTPR